MKSTENWQIRGEWGRKPRRAAVSYGLKDSDAQATTKQNKRQTTREGQGAIKCPSVNTEYALRHYSGKSRQICDLQVTDRKMRVKTTRLHGKCREQVWTEKGSCHRASKLKTGKDRKGNIWNKRCSVITKCGMVFPPEKHFLQEGEEGSRAWEGKSVSCLGRLCLGRFSKPSLQLYGAGTNCWMRKKNTD